MVLGACVVVVGSQVGYLTAVTRSDNKDRLWKEVTGLTGAGSWGTGCGALAGTSAGLWGAFGW
jgi:hypothetical protein